MIAKGPMILSGRKAPRVEFIPPKIRGVATAALSARIVGAGSTIDGSTLDAVDKFELDLRNANIFGKFVEMGLLVGNNLTGALRKFIIADGRDEFGTNVNFVAGDYTERGASGGLTGDGSTKYLRLDGLASDLPAADTGQVCVYICGAPTYSASRCAIGTGLGGSYAFIRYRNPQDRADALFGSTNEAAENGNMAAGMWAVDRWAANTCGLYKNGVLIDTESSAGSYTAPAAEFYLHARNNSGSAADYSNARIGFWASGATLTAAEHLALYQAVLALQTYLGRNA